MFDFHGWSLPPSARFLSGQLLEESSGDGIPASEGFHDNGLEKDTLRTAVLEMRPVLGCFPGFNGGGGGGIGGAKQERLLSWGCDADIEGNFPTIRPVGDVYVGGAGERARDKTRELFGGVERGVLRFVVNAISNSVVAPGADSVVVTAVHSVITKRVLLIIA